MDIKYALVTGSAGLVGSETVKFLSAKGMPVLGIDNDMRQAFFGREASTAWNRKQLEENVSNYKHFNCDIRDAKAIKAVFEEYGKKIQLIVHTAGQPSHDWAASDPMTDFTVNAEGTLLLLECMRQYVPEAAFIFCSTNKVYGDRPNELPLVEKETRWELQETHPYSRKGIDESMSIDATKHSLFGVSKAAADLLVQEYGRYFNLKTACFRAGCITGPAHSGTKLHGFLAYLMKCVVENQPYSVIGYKGKQVRDNIHSFDLVNAFWHFYQSPREAEVYNMGGSRHSNCSMIEAIQLCEAISGKKLKQEYIESARIGDHIWWISDVSKFKTHYPSWQYQYNLEKILVEIYEAIKLKK